MHPLSVQITTKDSTGARDLQYNYVLTTNFPRWELFKIFLKALFALRFK